MWPPGPGRSLFRPSLSLVCVSCFTGRAYENDPPRHPSYLVQCFKPFNGETPHQLLSDDWLTPAELFYVRNHLPVPTQLQAEAYR
jgi:sulfite oxidase